MEDALTLPVTAVKAAFNLTKAIIAPDGRCLAASAGGSRQRVKQVLVKPDHTGACLACPLVQ